MEVENHPRWKQTKIGDTPIFHWTMIIGGRVKNTLLAAKDHFEEVEMGHVSSWIQVFQSAF